MFKGLMLALATFSMVPMIAAADYEETQFMSDVESDQLFESEYTPMYRHGHRRGNVWACFAENRRGQIFRAFGRGSRREIQRAAMNHCFNYSRQCRPLGCRRHR